MKNLFNFLNANSGALNVIFSCVVAVATAIYALLTKSLTNETRKLRKVQTEPLISIAVIPGSDSLFVFFIEIENIGQGPAFDITTKFVPDFEIENRMNINDISFIKNLSYLKPGQKIKSFIGTWPNLEKNIEHKFEIKSIYKNINGDLLTSEINFDLNEFKNLIMLGKPPLSEISDSAKKIADAINKISSGTVKIKTEVFNQKDMELEDIDRELWYMQMQKQNSKQESEN